ncbi:hypothetical protein QQF64_011263 [Cirrhinus molitorella]|uniref:CCHC-type domain-containing protein n=1 Tax=Cirrhinus molitorella TaxID=172907 RepID=A0ABR3LYQ4_9TELE
MSQTGIQNTERKQQRQHQKDSGQGFQFNMKEGDLLQKEAFEKTALFSVIRDAVMTNFPAATEYKKEKCHICGKIGHIARACCNGKPRDRKSHPNGDTAKVAARHQSNEEDVNDLENFFQDMFALGCLTYKFGSLHCSELQKVKPYTVKLNVDGRDVRFELDTGCGLMVMNEACFKATWKESGSPKLEPETYTGEPTKVIGAAYVDVIYHQQRKKLPLIVVEGEGPSLLGRGWLEQIKLCWGEIRNVRIKESEETLKETLQGILQRHEEVFKEEVGTLKGMTATIHVKPGSVPKFFHPRSGPDWSMKKESPL